jgi:uncharacterized membrane protein YeaQ/YmgE (transglycosylase-associated protein family)
MISLLVFLLIGALAGFFAGKIMKKPSSDFWKNMILGVIGAFVGGFTFDLLGISAAGLIGSIITATVGAVIVIFAAEKLSK